MLRRAATMRFAAGAVVFPGGRVDEGDRELAARFGEDLSPQDAAARIAAIRETIEEAGIAVGFVAPPALDQVAAIRAALHAGASFGELLDGHGLSFDLHALDPFARWCPSLEVDREITRRFDTRFYVARMPDGAHAGTVDATENVVLRWVSAAEVLSDCDAGREFAIFPTLRNLEKLALGATSEAVLDWARAHPLEMVRPWLEEREGEVHLCIPTHLGYPVTSEPYGGVRRG
jgi:8-oxo-dGTP pyrophosphatase MutT (NUDIX family)